jgi:hypothetical protein
MGRVRLRIRAWVRFENRNGTKTDMVPKQKYFKNRKLSK